MIMGNICLIGVKGIGKTYLINRLKKVDDSFLYFTGSSMIRKVVGEEFPNFDAFTQERKEIFRDIVIKRFEEIQKRKGKNLVIDGHMTLYNIHKKTIESVVRKSDIDFYDHYILLHPTPELVYQRRLGDKLKQRILDREIIRQEIRREKEKVEEICAEYNKTLDVIDLPTENADEILLRIIRRYQ